LRGAVVDGRGQPVAGATVWVRAQNAGTRYVTDGSGGFEADLGAPGTASVSVVKTDFKSAGPVEVEVRDDQPTTVSLVLVADQAARALIVDAGGAPVAGALGASVVNRPADGPQLYAAARSADDGTFAVGMPPQPALAFISGPGCPLFAAQLPAPGGAASGAGATDGGGDAPLAGDAGAGGGAAPGGDAGYVGDAGNGEAPAVVLHCPPLPAAVERTITDKRGMPLRNAGFILRQQGVIVPQRVLALHLAMLGLQPTTDGSGHVLIAGLAPGDYDLFVATLSSEETVAEGLADGFLTSVSLAPLTDTELQLTLSSPGGRRQELSPTKEGRRRGSRQPLGAAPVDLVVGRSAWQSGSLARAVRADLGGSAIPVLCPADLVLFKLYAGGAQGAWDVQQLLAVEDRGALIAEVECRLADLPPHATALWRHIHELGSP
jgi:hypothetical protein